VSTRTGAREFACIQWIGSIEEFISRKAAKTQREEAAKKKSGEEVPLSPLPVFPSLRLRGFA